MNVNQTKAEMLKEKNTYDRIFEVTYRFVIITAKGSFVSSSSHLTLKGLFRELTECYQADKYHTAYITPISNGILELVEAKPVEITREELERIIEHIDYFSK